MRAKKLADRTAILLALIIDNTERYDDGSIKRLWIPRVGGQKCYTLDGYVYVSGSGDASALRSLQEKGLIRKEKLGAYSASATEEGILRFEREIVETGRIEELKRIVAKNESVMNGGADED